MAMATPVPTLGYWEAVSKLFRGKYREPRP
jgi:hypothetical protein